METLGLHCMPQNRKEKSSAIQSPHIPSIIYSYTRIQCECVMGAVIVPCIIISKNHTCTHMDVNMHTHIQMHPYTHTFTNASIYSPILTCASLHVPFKICAHFHLQSSQNSDSSRFLANTAASVIF